MEKGNSARLLSILALVIAVAGLSIGFAAYTSTLHISANANVEINATAAWNVGFALANGTMGNTTGSPYQVAGTGVTNPGAIDLYKYTIAQNTAATLSNVSGSSVSYAFKIKNDGTIAADLTSISGGGLTCTYNSNAASRTIETDPLNTGAEMTAATGSVDSTDCGTMFNAVLTINGHDYDVETIGTPSYTNMTIATGSSVDATLTISATGTAPTNALQGDFIVTLGAITVVYSSSTS